MADEQLIKPRELPAATSVFADDAIMTDDGVTVGKATPVQIVNAGAPVASEAEAIAGTDNSKRMTPLTTKQVLDSVTAPSVLRAQAWAESDSPPDPGIPGSMSAKSWAAEAERLGAEQADRAEAAAQIAEDVVGGLGTLQEFVDEAEEQADRAEAAAQIAEDVVGGLGTLQEFVDEAEEQADRAEGFANDAELAASTAANDANAQIAPNVAAAVAAKNSAELAKIQAEAARDAAGSIGLINRGWVADAAALSTITTPALNDMAMTLDNEHVWRWDGSAWVDRGASPLALKANKSEFDIVQLHTEETTMFLQLSGAGRDKPKAGIIILLGQSLNAPWQTSQEIKGAPVAKMLVGGSSTHYWQFNAVAADWNGNWADLASAVGYAEGAGQTPGVGIINAMAGGKYSRLYLCSAAIGARTLEALMDGGPFSNVHAAIYRLCDLARADGYDPEVMFYSAHGEANALSNTSAQDYYDLGMSYYSRAQLYAAQGMRKPGYIAPIVFTYPAQTNAGDAGLRDCRIKEGIRMISDNLPGAICLGPIYQWPMENDRVHPTVPAYVMRGEAVGKVLRDYTASGIVYQPLRVVDVVLHGDEFTVTFSEPVVRDDTVPYGQNLNASYAKDGLEWFDNGPLISITSLTYEGWRVKGKLGSEPSGSIENQELRIASQATTATFTAGPQNNAGSVIRARGDGWPSIFDPTYTNHKWASPQSFKKVRSA